jgi:hypothetical protein
VAASRTFYERLGWQAGLDVEETVFFQIGNLLLILWGRDKLAQDSSVTDRGGPACSSTPTVTLGRLPSTRASRSLPTAACGSPTPDPVTRRRSARASVDIGHARSS